MLFVFSCFHKTSPCSAWSPAEPGKMVLDACQKISEARTAYFSSLTEERKKKQVLLICSFGQPPGSLR